MQPQTNTPIKKIIVIVVCVLCVVIGLYFFVFHSATPQVTLDQFGNPTQSQVVGQDLLDLLNQLGTVQLDSSLFQEQAFINLTDDAITLPNEPKGRANPFQTIGSGGSFTPTTPSTQTPPSSWIIQPAH